MQTVHLRINDSVTKQPTAVRLRISGPNGETYSPFGRPPIFPIGKGEELGGLVKIGRELFSYIDGATELRLPTGVPIRLQIFKGIEYRPLDLQVTISPGKMALRFEIERWTNRADTGWLSADTRVQYLSPHAALLEAAAEDLDIANLLIRRYFHLANDGNTYFTYPNATAFSGQSALLEKGNASVVVNTFNEHPYLGKLSLLNSHRPVYPIAFGSPDDSDDWSIVDWCEQCHRKNGLVVWADAFRSEGGSIGSEALVAAILGKIDAIECDPQPRSQPFFPWVYKLWSAGIFLPLVGGSAKDSNATALGAMRTYAQIPKEEVRTYPAWVEAVRAGRTFATNGPILSFEVERIADATVTVRAKAECLTAFSRFEILANGETVASASSEPSDGLFRTKIEIEHTLNETTWFAARCIGGAPVSGEGTTFAHTSATLLSLQDLPFAPRPKAIAALKPLVDEVRVWAEDRGQYTDEKWRMQLVERCNAASHFFDKALG